MVTISHITKKLVDDRQFLHECMGKKLVNYGAVALLLAPLIEKELNKKVKPAAVMMALRRYSEELTRKYETKKPSDMIEDISIRTNVCDVVVSKSPTVFATLRKFQEKIDYSKGDVFNLIQGDYEIAIILNEKYRKKLLDLMSDERIVHKELSLAQLSIKVSEDFYETPGVILTMTRILNWENVNIYEIISTMTEINFLIKEKDVSKAYNAFMSLMDKKKIM